MSAAEKYRDALASCPPAGGGVHSWILGAANCAAFAEIPAPQAVAEITMGMSRPPSPPREVSDAVEKAYRESVGRVGLGLGVFVQPIQHPKPTPAPKTAEAFVRKGAGASEADLWEASPVRMDWGEDWKRDAVAQLRALFLPGELVFCGDKFGKEVRPVEDWIARIEGGEKIPPLLCPNPLKPGGGMTKAGKPSYRCDDAVAVFRHAVAEFDGMPIDKQIKFWVGLGLGAVTCLTYSGGKSIHALLRVDAPDAAAWKRNVRGRLFDRTLIPLGCDGACVNPSRLSRLAGATRADKGGAVQKLLFCREPLA